VVLSRADATVTRRFLCLAVLLAMLGTTPASTATASARTWWAQGWYAPSPVYRAKTLQVSGDSTYFMKRMHWARWGFDRARGHGRAAVNDCRPNCAEGSFHKFPVRVKLRDAGRVCGSRFFREILIVYPDRHPKGIPARDVRSYSIVC
jgi:hypothetical protein